MRRVRDHHLPDPFSTWIDQYGPLPPGVTVLPRTISVSTEVWSLASLGIAVLGLSVPTLLVVKTQASTLPVGGWVVLALMGAALIGMMAFVARRIWHALGARRDQQAGRLRQGILVGPEGVLVRHVPNWCYPIPIDRFVRAERWSGGGEDGSDYLRFVTLDGPVDVADEHFTVDADAVNQAVANLRGT